MATLQEFIINFGALESAEHEFEFKINDSFFQNFENSFVQRAQLDVLVTLEKQEHMLLLDFTIVGDITVNCDRCLEDLELEVESFNELVVKFGDTAKEESEDVIVISSKDNEIDVSKYVFEYITVLVPLRNVHEDENENPTCDPEVLKEIEKHSHTEHKEDETDPRWDSLKKINLN